MDKSYRRSLHRKMPHYIPADVIEEGNKKKSWLYGYNAIYDMVVISKDGTIGEVIELNGKIIALPSQPKNIRFGKYLKPEMQKWKRYNVPDDLSNFDKIYGDAENVSNQLETVYQRHIKFIEEDVSRIKNGDWICIDGDPMYITGYHYAFLQHYFLTDMNRYPDFREPQRDYFIWVESCFADERCLGSLLLKSRRSSFSTSSGSIIDTDAIFTKNGFYPIVSKKDTDAQDLFTKHIVKPFLRYPKHLQPQRVGEATPKKELFFSAPKKKMTVNNKIDTNDSGLDTLITFYATTLDAYDGTQVTKSINDEIGKMKGGLDINEYWEQAHKMCHIVGSQVVGKALCGSTANPPNKGGKNYEKFYDNSKFSKARNGRTSTGLHAIFIAADYTQMGFFDEWGFVIYDDPSEPIKNELGRTTAIGVKRFLDEAELACGDDIKKLYAQKRNNPRVDTDAFLDDEASSMYGKPNVINTINFLKEYQHTPKYKTQVFRFDLKWKNGIPDTEVFMERNDKGRFMASWLPPVELRNRVKKSGERKTPMNGNMGTFSCDPYQASKVAWGNGSKMAFIGFTTDNAFDLEEKNTNKMFLFYNHRPDTREEAEEDVIKALVYFSMPILPERNKDALCIKLKERGYRGFVLENPLKKKSELSDDDQKLGGIWTEQNNVPKLQAALETWISENLPEDPDEDNLKVPFLEVLEDWVLYTDETKKKHDMTVASQIGVVALTSRKIQKKEAPIVEMPNYNIMQYFEKNG